MKAIRQDRRAFIKAVAAGLGAAVLAPMSMGACGALEGRRLAGSDGWDEVPRILSRIRAPRFPGRDFLISDYGARSADATDGIRRAIEACASAGGGRVVVPAGTYTTGPIHLKSGVNLHVSDGATLRFKTDPEAYLPAVFSRWEGMELMNYSPLIYGFEQENIAVTGTGTLDGGGDAAHWWPWKGRAEYGWQEGAPEQGPARKRLETMVEQGAPVEERLFGGGDFLRPPFIQPYRCTNVLIEGVTIINSPFWEVHPVLCTNVTVRGLTIRSHGPNNDGCDPESCTDVLIEDCSFDTGDDCIAIKSGRNADGRRVAVPSANIIIRNCDMKDGHGGVVIGSEISGGCHHVFAENCRMDSPNLERALRIKTNSVRGGTVEHVYMRSITIGQVSDAVVRVNFLYEEGDAGSFLPTVRHIEVRDVTCEKSRYALYLRGYERSPVQDVLLANCRFNNVKEESIIENVEDLDFEDVWINGRRAG